MDGRTTFSALTPCSCVACVESPRHVSGASQPEAMHGHCSVTLACACTAPYPLRMPACGAPCAQRKEGAPIDDARFRSDCTSHQSPHHARRPAMLHTTRAVGACSSAAGHSRTQLTRCCSVLSCSTQGSHVLCSSAVSNTRQDAGCRSESAFTRGGLRAQGVQGYAGCRADTVLT